MAGKYRGSRQKPSDKKQPRSRNNDGTGREKRKEHTIPEIPEEIQPYLSNAKRHHYVPEFLLRRFSTNPTDEHPPIYRLEVKTGALTKLSTNNCAVIQHYNRLSAATGLHVGFVEALLSFIEGKTAPLVKKLLHGDILSLPERVDFSTFLMAQQLRTPRGREWLRFGQDQAAKYWLLKQVYENREVTTEHLREELGRDPSEDEINASIRQLAEPLERDELFVSGGLDLEILGMFTPAPELVPVIGEMNWTVLEAPVGHSFILSDDPLVRLDPLNPDGPAAWRSSPTVEATMPLDPRFCLRLRQPPPAQNSRSIPAEVVLDINLRTYAAAQEVIFGPTEQLLESIHAAAKDNALRVDLYRPKPPNLYLIEHIEGEKIPDKVTRIPGPREITIRRPRCKIRLSRRRDCGLKSSIVPTEKRQTGA